jgi:hypothetical protein
MAVDWLSLATTVVGAGFGTALVQVLPPIIRDARHRKHQAAYMAMRLAVVLEAYASKCLDLIHENESVEEEASGQHEHEPLFFAQLPELPPYPDDVDGWRAIDRKLADLCLSFRNRIHDSQNIIDSTFKFVDADAGGSEVAKQATDRGLEAWEIAAALRRTHAVEKVDTVWPWVDALRERKARRSA